MLAQRRDELVGDRQRAVEPIRVPAPFCAGRGGAALAASAAASSVSSALGPKPFSSRILCSVAACSQRVERVDTELLKQPAGALGSESGQVGQLQQARAGTWRSA